jgi:predicted NUDIX family phosphoesterase
MLDTILAERSKFRPYSEEWLRWDNEKIKFLEATKPSTREKIFFYYSEDIKNMPTGFVPTTELPDASLYVSNRSVLEYSGGLTRHIIPYCVVKCEDEYYFTVRIGGGETRLLNKLGCLGGHVGKEGIDAGMMRELEEEADITDNKIKSLKMKGFIKSDGDRKDPIDVSRDHLALVYVINLRKKDIREEEEGILKGVWIHKDRLMEHYDSMEDWTKILVENEVII